MRKWSIIFLTFLLFLTGCATSTQPEKTTDTGPEITHAMGTTKVPTNAKRVVVLTNEGLEALLAVGVKPVGAVHAFTGGKTWYKHLEKDMIGITDVGDELQPNLDKIASLKPDLIIGSKVRQEKIYKHLSGLAPTVFSETLGGDWKKNLKLYTKAVNKEKEGEEVLAKFDKRVSEIRQKAGDKLKQEVSMVRFVAGQTRLYNNQSFCGIILKEIGFARPKTQNKEVLMEVVTKERTPDMNGDILFYFVYDTGDGKANKLRDEWMKDRLWQQLDVVKKKQAYEVDDVVWITAGGVKAADLLLNDIEKYIVKNSAL